MKITITKSTVFLLLAAAVSLTSCWKEDFDDCAEDGPGSVTLLTDWSDHNAAAEIPAEYHAFVGDYYGLLAGERNLLDHPFAEGDHHVNVYNTPERIEFDGLEAFVQDDGAGISNMPGYLFTYSGDELGLRKREHRVIYAPMTQQVGRLTYEMVMEDGSDIADFISGITSVKLTGIAAAIDIETGDLSEPSSVAPPFVLDPATGSYTSETRMLGTIGASQKLTIGYTITGAVGEYTLTKDLYSVLEDFNAHKAGAYHVQIVVLGLGNMPGKITLTPDWSGRAAGVAIPADYTAVISDYKGVLSGASNTLAHDFTPGDHHVRAYNTPAGMEINGTVADVSPAGSGIDAMPAELFTYSGDILDLLKNETRTVTATMAQQTGTVKYVLKMKDNSNTADYVTAVTAKLEGIASRIDLETAALSKPSHIAPVFAFATDRYTAESRIIGTIGVSQMLTLEVTLPGGTKQTLSRDAASILAGFNADKKAAYTIVVEIENVDSTTGRILDWTIGNGLNGNIE